MAGAWTLYGFGMFSVVEKTSGRWIGRLGPWQPDGWPGSEVGWGLVPDAWGKGYATEGATAAIDWAFAKLGWTEVIHCIDPKNTPSQKVAQRLGSRYLREGMLPAPISNATQLWGQSREEWKARKKP
jgi:RimJ/RimL family protein N-acetyltransferase